MFDTYKPSGAISILAAPAFLVGMLFCIGLAYVYQLLLYWIPLIYINAILTFVFGFAVGTCGRLMVKRGHVRNVWVALILGLLLGAGSLGAKFWFQYQTFLGEVAQEVKDVAEQISELEQQNGEQGFEELPAVENVNKVLEDPRQAAAKMFTFMEHIQYRVNTGLAIGGGGGNGLPITGIFMYLLWLVEALIVLGFAVWIPGDAAAQPYSETFNKWASEQQIIMTLPITNDEMVQQIQDARSVDELLNIPIPKTDESNRFAIYTVSSIPGEEMEDAYLTVTLVRLIVDKKGTEKKEETPLVKNAVLTSEQRNQLLENAELLNEAIAEYHKARQSGELTNHDSDDKDTEVPSEDADENQA